MISDSTLIVDVGGTSTRFLVAGRLVKKSATDLKNLPSLIKKMVRRSRATSITVGIRGIWTKNEKRIWLLTLASCAKQVTVLSDVELAHWMAFQGRPGIILVAGTGSICYGKTLKGNCARAGGLGPYVGDEGSGFWIGQQYLKLLAETPRNLIQVRRFLTSPNPVQKIASLAPIVCKRAQQNKKGPEAKIVSQAKKHLSTLIQQVKMELGPDGGHLQLKTHGSIAKKLFY